MLQIISGRFFQSSDRHAFDAYGILYSNVVVWEPVETSVATVHPVDPHGSVARYVVSYRNQIEKGAGPVRTGDAQIVEHLSLLASFGFRGFFSTSRREVAHVCRAQQTTSGDHAPSQLADRFCDPRIRVEAEQVARFTTLVDAVIGLRRKAYVAVIEYLRNFVGALRAVDENVDLAYSMLIYGLESLAQEFGDYQPTWDDIEDKVRKPIDAILADDPARLKAVRDALLLSTHTRTQERMKAFIERSLPDDFFIGAELASRKLPLRYSQLRRAIRNAYNLRSGFVHTLKRGEQLDPFFGKWDVMTRRNEPYFSFRGLVRVAEAVLWSFIHSQEKVESEEVDWRSGLPGVVMAELAPQYWVWRVDTFQPEYSRQRLSGFLSHLEEAQAYLDLRDLITVIGACIRSSKGSQADRRAMAALYLLYHGFAPQDESPPDGKVMDMGEALLREPTVESLVTVLILERPCSWTVDEIERAIDEYQKQKFGKLGLTLGARLEAALLAHAGNQRRESGQREAAHAWFRRAILELVGHPEKQQYIDSCFQRDVAVDVARLVRSWTTAVDV